MPAIITHDMVRLENYTAAKVHWRTSRFRFGDDTVSLTECKRKEHKRLQRNDDGSFALCLYATPLITYYPDGNTRIRPWNSMSSHSFIWYHTERGLSTGTHGNYAYVRTPHGVYFPRTAVLLDRSLKLLTPPNYLYQRVRATINKPAHAAAVQKLRKFKRWHAPMRTLHNVPQHAWNAYDIHAHPQVRPQVLLAALHADDYLAEHLNFSYEALRDSYLLTHSGAYDIAPIPNSAPLKRPPKWVGADIPGVLS